MASRVVTELNGLPAKRQGQFLDRHAAKGCKTHGSELPIAAGTFCLPAGWGAIKRYLRPNRLSTRS